MRLKILILFSFLSMFAEAFAGFDDEITLQPTLPSVSEPHVHPHGKPLNVMQFTQNQSVSVDYDELEKLFLHEEVANRKIVVVSIIGAFRKGKSFFLDYCLRFMYAKYKSINFMSNPLDHKGNWIGSYDEPLSGFSWKSGPHRHTSGVVIWSDVFLHEVQTKDKTTEKIAIILMDTQGLFDAQTKASDNSKIFALGTLISSMQIFNLNGVIQEDQLEYLRMATDYAKFVTNNTIGERNKPFQNLLFLQRDWTHDSDYAYGLGGGSIYLAEILKIQQNQSDELRDVREYIKVSFDWVFCFLLPHPGLSVVTDNFYDGRFSQLDEPFQKHLKFLIEWLLDPDEIKKKKKRVLNSEVTGKEFNNFVREYFETFQSSDTPKILSIYEATIERQLMNYVEAALSNYKEKVKTLKPDYDSPNFIQDIEEYHKATEKTAILWYNSQKKMGSIDHDKKYRDILSKEIETFYVQWNGTLIETRQKMLDIKAENERQMKELKEKNEEAIRNETLRMESEKAALKIEMEERENELAKNLQMKEEEKKAAIEALQEEFGKKNIEYEKKMQHWINQQQIERDIAQKAADDRAKAAEKEIEELKKDRENKQNSYELQLQADREMRMEIMKKEAEERKEEKRREQERLDREDALRKEELEMLKFKFDKESEQRKLQLEREEARRKEEKIEREQEVKVQEALTKQELIERENARRDSITQFNLQMQMMRGFAQAAQERLDKEEKARKEEQEKREREEREREMRRQQDRDDQIAKQKMEADERREDRLLQQQRLDRQEAHRREEMKMLMERMEREAQDRREQWDREEARKAEEREEHAEENRRRLGAIQQDMADRQAEREEMNQQQLLQLKASKRGK